jgi:hypothetical protein
MPFRHMYCFLHFLLVIDRVIISFSEVCRPGIIQPCYRMTYGCIIPGWRVEVMEDVLWLKSSQGR